MGWELGAGRPGKAELVVKICLRMALVYSVLLIIILAGFNGPIAGIFSENPLVLANARTAMVIVAVAAMPDAVTVVYAGGLRGAGDTRFVAISGMLSTMILRPGLAFLAVYVLHWSLAGVWIAFASDFFLRGGLNWYRFHQKPVEEDPGVIKPMAPPEPAAQTIKKRTVPSRLWPQGREERVERKALASRLLLPVRSLSQQERQTLGTAKEEYGRAWNIAWPAMIELIMISLAGHHRYGHGGYAGRRSGGRR